MKNPWCKAPNDAECTCPRGSCWAERNADILTDLNSLLGYGLGLDEIGEDMRDRTFKP